jgi:beta-N-acetylhexosaminidase
MSLSTKKRHPIQIIGTGWSQIIQLGVNFIILYVFDDYDNIIFYSYDAYRDEVQKDLINSLLNTLKEVFIVSIKGPIDMKYFNNLKNYACLYEYTPNSIKTIIKQLKGEISLNGKLPL